MVSLNSDHNGYDGLGVEPGWHRQLASTGQRRFEDAAIGNNTVVSGTPCDARVICPDWPGLSLSDLFIQARVAVMQATDDQQVPWEEGGLTARFYLNPSTEPATKAVLEEPEPKATAVSNDQKFEGLKQKCIDIGFEPGTETFGECLLKLMDQP